MRLRNKKTGAIYNIEDIEIGNNEDGIWLGMGLYKSLAELNEEWEDYEEPKDYYFIDDIGVIETSVRGTDDKLTKQRQSIANYFESKEEAEKAVEKLKSWKRIKDKGFRFCGWATNEGIRGVDFEVPDSFFSEHNHSCISDETKADLDLLFSQEDE